MVATVSESVRVDDKELECTNNPSYEVMRLHRPMLSQAGRSDEREYYAGASNTYANVH